jgi:hypothetical protein
MRKRRLQEVGEIEEAYEKPRIRQNKVFINDTLISIQEIVPNTNPDFVDPIVSAAQSSSALYAPKLELPCNHPLLQPTDAVNRAVWEAASLGVIDLSNLTILEFVCFLDILRNSGVYFRAVGLPAVSSANVTPTLASLLFVFGEYEDYLRTHTNIELSSLRDQIAFLATDSITKRPDTLFDVLFAVSSLAAPPLAGRLTQQIISTIGCIFGLWGSNYGVPLRDSFSEKMEKLLQTATLGLTACLRGLNYPTGNRGRLQYFVKNICYDVVADVKKRSYDLLNGLLELVKIALDCLFVNAIIIGALDSDQLSIVDGGQEFNIRLVDRVVDPLDRKYVFFDTRISSEITMNEFQMLDYLRNIAASAERIRFILTESNRHVEVREPNLQLKLNLTKSALDGIVDSLGRNTIILDRSEIAADPLGMVRLIDRFSCSNVFYLLHKVCSESTKI